MTSLLLDESAWTNHWRHRSTGEKSLLSLGLLAVAATSGAPQVAWAAGLVAVTAALVLARVPWRTYLLAWTGPLPFVLLGAATIAVTLGAPVAPVWQFGVLVVEPDGLQRAVQVLSRSMAGVSCVLLLATTTPLSDLLAGLRRLRVPPTLVDVAALMYRMVFGLLESAVRIHRAQAARLGFVDARAARRSVGLLGAATLRQAWLRSQRLEEGLAGRGYTGELTVLAPARPVSAAFVTVSVLLLALLAGWSVLEAVG